MPQRPWIRVSQHGFQFFCLAAGAIAAMAGAASAQEKLLGWHDTLEGGTQAARASGKPLFVVFRCVR